MKLFIIVLFLIIISFIILTIIFGKKKQPGLTPVNTPNKVCNIHNTIMCENSNDCATQCMDSINTKCFKLYYQNYIWPSWTIDGVETIAAGTPSGRVFKLYNEDDSYNQLNYIDYSDLVIPDEKIQTGANSDLFPYSTYTNDTIGTTGYTFPAFTNNTAAQLISGLSDKDREALNLPLIKLPKNSDVSNLVPMIDKQKNLLPTCMHTDKVCAYWRYYPQSVHLTNLCGGQPGQDPESPSCKNSEYYWRHYYQPQNLINYDVDDIETNKLDGMDPIEYVCNHNMNCKGYLTTKNLKHLMVGTPNFSSVPFNQYNQTNSYCLPTWSPTNASPSTPYTPNDTTWCAPTITPSTSDRVNALLSGYKDDYNVTLVDGDKCTYNITSDSTPPTQYKIDKTCTPTEIDISNISKNATAFTRKTCSFYDSIDFTSSSPYFSASIPLNERMYNMQQFCNNQTHCIWRDVMSDASWELVDKVVMPADFTCEGTNCTFEKLKYINSNLFPHERMMYQIMPGGDSKNKSKKIETKEFCVESDPDSPSNVCETLLGISPVTKDDFDENSIYSYKIINFGCADMVGAVNNNINSTTVKPDNDYLYYNNLLCQYKLQCYIESQEPVNGQSKTKQDITNSDSARRTELCNSPTVEASVSLCRFAPNIRKLQEDIENLESTIPSWETTPINTKTGVCLKPPNTMMSNNPCNLYTAESTISKTGFNSNPVCRAFESSQCNDDMYCYLDGECKCKGFCETSPSIYGPDGNAYDDSTIRVNCEKNNCMYMHNSPTKCQSIKYNWTCSCLNNPFIQELFEEDNNRCDKLQPTRDIPEVIYYTSPSKLYMQYSDNCCYFDKNSELYPAPSSLNKNDVYPSGEISPDYKNKCETNECTLGDKLFGQLVVPECSFLSIENCDPNAGTNPNTVDQTWPCEVTTVDGVKYCTNKVQYKAGNLWEEDCYTVGGDGQKMFRYDTCWNPLYGVLAPCGITYPNNAYNGDMNEFQMKKCQLTSCCDQQYTVTPQYVAYGILKKPIQHH